MEQLLIMSNFTFCHNDFKSRLLQRLIKGIYSYVGNGLNRKWRKLSSLWAILPFATMISKVVCCRGSYRVYTRMWKRVKTINRESLLWAISPFATMISKVVCCRGKVRVYTRMWERVKTVEWRKLISCHEQFHLLPQWFQNSSVAEAW